MFLYLVHCGFYDSELSDGLYESHTNIFVAAESFEDARARAKFNPDFKKRKMHVDGIQQIEAVDGFQIRLEADAQLEGKNVIANFKHRDLASKS
ncbi:DUF1543 domain-containing protein [bacterium]|nr:DUF1543 domain-containing protein [bacterium]